MTLARTKQFLRRRGGVMSATFGVGALLALGLLVPHERYVGRATAAPAGPGYAGSIAWLQAQLTTRAAQVTSATALDVQVEPLEAQRGPRGELEQLIVRATAAGADEALAAAERLCRLLIEADRERRHAREERVEDGETGPGGPSLAALRVELEALRQQHPRLADAELGERAAERREEARRAREALEAAGLQRRRLGEEVALLEADVEQEARRAYVAHRAQQQAEALARAQRARQLEAAAQPAPARSSGPTRAELLRQELDRLLSTRTRRHPEVRRVERELELELQREQEGRAPTGRLEARDDERAAGAPPTRGFVLAGADGDAPPGARAPGALALDVPDAWLQRAPSYPLLQEARRRAREAELELELAQRQQEQLAADAVRLTEQLAALAAPRLEEARLLGAIEEAQRAPVSEASAERAPLEPPLVRGEPARIERVVGAGRFPLALVVAALAALGVGLLVERQDRTIYDVEDLLGADVLGVVPRLRGR